MPALPIIALSLALAALGTFAPPPAPAPSAILGWWHGISTCVKAPWNSACNDEHVVYQFVPASPDSVRSILHAFKIVHGRVEPMYDLDFSFAADSQMWLGDFANERVDIRWRYRLQGDTLFGEVVLRPSLRIGRHVTALRGQAGPP